MPLNVKRFLASIFLVVFSFIILSAQTVPTTTPVTPQATPVAPTSGEIMRARISRAKAFIAIKNYSAAIYEMENIRRETSDQAVHGALNVLLMNCYLEQGDYKRAQDFLNDLFNGVKANKFNAAANYYAAAGQVIKGARNQSERYKALGLAVSDRNLPPDAVTDLEKMRETLEKVVEQSKTLGKDAKQTANAFALLEETTTARALIARDDYDAKRWKDEVADSRETLANSRSTIVNAMTETPAQTSGTVASNTIASNTVAQNTIAPNTIASNNPNSLPQNTLPVPSNQEPAKTETPKTNQTAPVFQPVSANPNVTSNKEVKPNADSTARTDKPAVNEPSKQPEAKKTEETPKTNSENTVAANSQPQQTRRDRRVGSSEEKTETKSENTTAQTDASSSNEPLKVGSLLEFAVERKNPVYPASARQLRQTGVVRLELVIDENGQVAEVQNLSGPTLLQSAVKDAVKKWKFKPFTRDGQPVKATGFLSFNFNL